MQVSFSSSDPAGAKVDALVIAVREFDPQSGSPFKKLGFANLCSEIDPHGQFCGKEGSVTVAPTLGRIGAQFIALVGLGKTGWETPSPVGTNEMFLLRRCFGKAIRQLFAQKARSFGILFESRTAPPDWVPLVIEEATYHFQDFMEKKEQKKGEVSKIILFLNSSPKISESIQMARSIRYARQLANQPPNLFYPENLAQQARDLARCHKMKCTVWDPKRLKKEGFGGILAVGQGSRHPPCFIRLDYQGTSAKQAPMVVIGKAITFDTGGISIKPSDKMDEMKFDKCGGIAVLGIMDAVAALKLPLNVTGLISSAENMPGSNAYRPGDMVKSLSGKYIEVLNTDAEGRIVLADALTFAQKLKPRAMVDLATLTGACVICFGHECAAVLGNQSRILEGLRAASARTGEKIWPLPLWNEYQEKVKSDIGFVKNTAGREGGTITGAAFLNAFVDPKVPWAHLDIAGMAWTSKEESHRAKGATAFGIHLVTDWLRSMV